MKKLIIALLALPVIAIGIIGCNSTQATPYKSLYESQVKANDSLNTQLVQLNSQLDNLQVVCNTKIDSLIALINTNPDSTYYYNKYYQETVSPALIDLSNKISTITDSIKNR